MAKASVVHSKQWDKGWRYTILSKMLTVQASRPKFNSRIHPKIQVWLAHICDPSTGDKETDEFMVPTDCCRKQDVWLLKNIWPPYALTCSWTGIHPLHRYVSYAQKQTDRHAHTCWQCHTMSLGLTSNSQSSYCQVLWLKAFSCHISQMRPIKY